MMGFGPMMGGFGLGAGQTPAQAAADQTAAFQAMASATGLSVQTIAAGWSQGQSLAQIAEANGITAAQLRTDMQNYRLQQLKDELAALVANGTITQAQSDARLQFVQSQMANAPSGRGAGFGMGFGRHYRGFAGVTSTPGTNQ